jgi:hypothetical protein
VIENMGMEIAVPLMEKREGFSPFIQKALLK